MDEKNPPVQSIVGMTGTLVNEAAYESMDCCICVRMRCPHGRPLSGILGDMRDDGKSCCPVSDIGPRASRLCPKCNGLGVKDGK